MRAMVLRGTNLAVEEVPRPAPGPGQVLARVRTCGICGSDLHFARYGAELGGSSPERGVLSRADVSRGVIMGHEFVAEVAELGPGVSGWSAGDRVVSVPVLVVGGDASRHSIGYSSEFPGAYGEYVLLSAPLLLRVPDSLEDQTAALTEPCAVALHAVREAAIAGPEAVLVMGAGPIGLLTALWLKHYGHRVAVSDPEAPRRDLASALGVDVVLDPAGGDVATGFARAFGGPPAFIFECVGVAGTLAEAMRLAAPRGRVIVAGVCMVEDRIRPLVAINKHLTLQFVLAYTAAEFAEALSALAERRIAATPLVTRAVSLTELPAAFASLSRPSDCKVVLQF